MALRAAFDAAVAQDLPLSMDVQDRQTLIDEVGAERSNVDMIPTSVQQMRIIRIGDQVDVCPCAGTHVVRLAKLRSRRGPRQKQGEGDETVRLHLGRPADLIRER